MSVNAARFDPVADDVFARIADRYDRLCDVFSFGAHRLWKAAAARRIARDAQSGVLLDVASGTGDIPLRVLAQTRAGTAPARLIVSDLCPRMLDQARHRIGERPGVEFAVLDAHALDAVPDASVDQFSISFGMKICDRTRVLHEARRVLKSGGFFYCLEAARIPFAPLHAAYLAYMDVCVPWIAQAATGGDRSAYDYLLRGIHDFPDQRVFAAEITAHGFTSTRVVNMSLGIVALHMARRAA